MRCDAGDIWSDGVILDLAGAAANSLEARERRRRRAEANARWFSPKMSTARTSLTTIRSNDRTIYSPRSILARSYTCRMLPLLPLLVVVQPGVAHRRAQRRHGPDLLIQRPHVRLRDRERVRLRRARARARAAVAVAVAVAAAERDDERRELLRGEQVYDARLVRTPARAPAA
eukprot:29885-Pelagococcus_subviridis.AAC.2